MKKNINVMLFCPSVRYAMGHYLDVLATDLNSRDNIVPILLVPDHYEGHRPSNSITFKSGNKLFALIQMMNPITHLRLFRSVAKTKPDVLHVVNGEGYLWTISVCIAARLFNIPVLITVHDPQPHPGEFFDRLSSFLRKMTLPLARAIHVHYKDDEFQHKYAHKCIFVISHPNFASRFTQYYEKDIVKNNDLLFFGRQAHYKGLHVLLEALPFLPGDHTLIIAGPGRIPRELMQKIAASQTEIELINRYISDKEVCEFFQRSRLLVLPYLQATQSSLPQLGAAFGLEIIATDVGSFTTEVPALGGKIIPPEDPKQLAEAISCAVNRRKIEKESLPPSISDDDPIAELSGVYEHLICP